MTISRPSARAAGVLYYSGKPCTQCGGTERYVSSGGCISCGTKRTGRPVGRPRDPAREAAQACGQRTYGRANPCPRCGGHTFYAKNAICASPACNSRRNAMTKNKNNKPSLQAD